MVLPTGEGLPSSVKHSGNFLRDTPRGLISKYLQTLLSWQMSWAIIIPSRNLTCYTAVLHDPGHSHPGQEKDSLGTSDLTQFLWAWWHDASHFRLQTFSAPDIGILYRTTLYTSVCMNIAYFFSCLIKIFVFLSGLSKNWPGGKNSSWHLRKIEEPGTFWDTGPRRIW